MESIPYDKRSGKIWFNGKTVEWADGEAPDERGGDGGYDVYQYTIIATGTGNYDWLVLANQTNMN